MARVPGRRATDLSAGDGSQPAAPRPLGVLMVTGVWAPEISGGSLQCRTLVRALGAEVGCRVLTTTSDPSLAGCSTIEGVPVDRLHVRPDSAGSLGLASLRMALALARLPAEHRIVHLHGFSRKSILLIHLARLQGRRVIVKLTSDGDDDAASIRARGQLAWSAFRRAHAWVAVSPAFAAKHERAGLPSERLHLIPNGVDVARFHPPSPDERTRAREALQLPVEAHVLLCVGFFSRDKRPDLVLDALLRLPREERERVRLLFVGATRSRYHEVDPSIAEAMKARARAEGVLHLLEFEEHLDPIEPAYHAADAFVLPSLREGLPNALLEAMACGLPCVASRLPGVTDGVIDDGANGRLFPPGDPEALSRLLAGLLSAPGSGSALGHEARATIEERFTIAASAKAHLALYRELAG